MDLNRCDLAVWGDGGFMTLWFFAQTTRFRAAMTGAGMANDRSYAVLVPYRKFEGLLRTVTVCLTPDPALLAGDCVGRA